MLLAIIFCMSKLQKPQCQKRIKLSNLPHINSFYNSSSTRQYHCICHTTMPYFCQQWTHIATPVIIAGRFFLKIVRIVLSYHNYGKFVENYTFNVVKTSMTPYQYCIYQNIITMYSDIIWHNILCNYVICH